MLGRHRGTTLAIVLLAIVGLWGCDSGNEITTPAFDPQDVQTSAELAAIVGPSAQAAQDIIVGLMQGVGGGVAPMTTDDGSLIPTRETSVHLDNGVSGDCLVQGTGVIECSFSGTTLVNGHAVDVSGSLTASLAASQPASGTRFDIDFDAQAASATLGNATWSSLGTLTLDETGAPADYDFTMTHTVTPLGGATSVVTVVVSPSQFELVVTGPMGGTVRINLNRDTMSGMVYVNSRLVATLAVEGDCTNVDFVDDRHQDLSICPQS